MSSRHPGVSTSRSGIHRYLRGARRVLRRQMSFGQALNLWVGRWVTRGTEAERRVTAALLSRTPASDLPLLIQDYRCRVDELSLRKVAEKLDHCVLLETQRGDGFSNEALYFFGISDSFVRRHKLRLSRRAIREANPLATLSSATERVASLTWRGIEFRHVRTCAVLSPVPFIVVPRTSGRSRKGFRIKQRSFSPPADTHLEVGWSSGWDPESITCWRVDLDSSGLSLAAWLYPDEVDAAIQALGAKHVAAHLASAHQWAWPHRHYVDRWAFLAQAELRHWLQPNASNSELRFYVGKSMTRSVVHGLPQQVPMRSGNLVTFRDGSESVPSFGRMEVTFTNVEVQGGGLILSPDGRGRVQAVHIVDPGADPRMERSPEVWGDVYSAASRGDRALVWSRPSADSRVPEAILGGGRNDWNWYHWMAEYLPTVTEGFEDTPLYVPVAHSDRVPAAGREALRLLSPRGSVMVRAAARTSFGVLHAATPAATLLDWYWPDPGRWQFIDVERLGRFRERLLRLPRTQSFPDQVFLLRGSRHRRLLGQERLARQLSRLGITPINMAGMSFRDQVALFSGARLVISASGAFMANFLMMPNGSRVVLATSQANVDSVLPATIARIGGVRTIYVVGSPTVNLEQAKSLHDWKHSDFRVSLEDVVEAIHA